MFLYKSASVSCPLRITEDLFKPVRSLRLDNLNNMLRYVSAGVCVFLSPALPTLFSL